MKAPTWLAACLVALALTDAAAAASASPGESIYRLGVLESGRPVQASRQEGAHLSGAAVACVNCHRRSGLGGHEGRTTIPPVAGPYLFQSDSRSSRRGGLPYAEGVRPDREPYSDATLTRAIRDGVDSSGKSLSYLMPRYRLDDADMAALIAHLKTLDPRQQPGVTGAVLHLATIFTPDADAVKQQGVLDVMRRFVAERNARQRAPGPQLMTSERAMLSKSMFRPVRQWELHVWQLRGPPETWGTQLDGLLAKQPVFAVLSGLGGGHWAPVHAFCERAALPCLFPNVDAPPLDADHGFYNVYFTQGVALEAELIAHHLRDALHEQPVQSVQSVQQIYRAGDAGAAGARVLAMALKKLGIGVAEVELPADGAAGDGVTSALARRDKAQAAVLWLRAADLAALSGAPPQGLLLYVSGSMGGLERAPLPAAWRERVRMAYPMDLPERRRVRVDFAMGWFSIHRIPVVALREQADTFLACGLLSETINHMADTMVRDYLIERMEDMIERRIVTGFYPRLALGPGQRFASKGGYVVRFDAAQKSGVVADSEWTTP